MISTHTLTWSVTKTRWLNVSNSFHFNSHAHVERDLLCFTVSLVYVISTHTLTWSVTWRVVRRISTLSISTHTLTWSVTKTRWLNVSNSFHFNSHAHVERDLLCFTVSLVYVISTHTLTWSVTWRVVRRISTLSISTHTLTWSVTQKNICRTPIKSFQLTRSRGAWPKRLSQSQLVEYFNSHAHVERDQWIPVP